MIEKCPHCGDTKGGYIYKRTVKETILGNYSSILREEIDDFKIIAIDEQAECLLCGKMINLPEEIKNTKYPSR